MSLAQESANELPLAVKSICEWLGAVRLQEQNGSEDSIHERRTPCWDCQPQHNSLARFMYEGMFGLMSDLLRDEPELARHMCDDSHIGNPVVFRLKSPITNTICPLSALRALLRAGMNVSALDESGNSILTHLLRTEYASLHLLEQHIRALLLFGAPVGDVERDASEKALQWFKTTIPPSATVEYIALGGALHCVYIMLTQWPDVDQNTKPSIKQLQLQRAFLHTDSTFHWVLGDFLLHGIDFHSICHWTPLEEWPYVVQ